MKIIRLTGANDNRPRKQIIVDEFAYTISTSSGESVITLPGSRTYTDDEHLVVFANGLKIFSELHYSRSSNTTITGLDSESFPEGIFQINVVWILNFLKLIRINEG